ncbi:SLOG family protein [Microcoleus sp. bin38.metabat.b11b12b14.051]|uniref:SLOG family protein n=1 Tax=Microcoleus sp. bin38.metabat.b11b12b14.051 TaxID=2742709 RepID=UPI0026015881|nr:SLOG family protein [Microcoleus sp. bin38.metabat.b11b12b14.051]
MYSPKLELHDYMVACDREINQEPEYMEYHTAFFTGHRYITVFYKSEINSLIDMALNQGVSHFLSGMAVGTDMLAAECLVDRALAWTAVIPCADQHKRWPLHQQKRYEGLVAQANKKIVLYPEYKDGVMQARNLYMVKHSDLCLAIYDNSKTGGTALTVRMARQKLIYQYNPQTSKFSIHEPSHQLNLFA